MNLRFFPQIQKGNMFEFMLPLTTSIHFSSPKAFLFPFKNFPLLFYPDLAFCHSSCIQLTKACSNQTLPLWVLLMIRESKRLPLGGSIPDQYKVLSMLESPAPLPSQLALVLPNPQPGSSASKKFCEVSVPSNKFPFA